MKSQQGFTLIELMVTIVILAIVLGIAIPSFSNILLSNRIDTGAQELYGSLQIARSEAVKRRGPVQVCRAKADFSGCNAGEDWSDGWVMVAGDELLRVWEMQGLEVKGPSAGVTFYSTGMVAAEEAFEVTAAGCNNDQKRAIAVRKTGSATLKKEAC